MAPNHPVKIGSESFDTNIFLAPLSGCADLAFRLIAREHGAKFCFFEMIDAHSVTCCGPRRRTLSILDTVEADKPIAAQLLGEDPALMLCAAKEILKRVEVSFLDINAACPAKKVVKKKAGAYLLKDPKRLASIIRKLSLALPVPVTVKMRLGYDEDAVSDIDRTAKDCEDNGASAIFVHGRTRIQGYSGLVDYGSIKRIKDGVKIPVFASGNVFSPELAKKMFDETGCDGILVGRGALGNPWIFGRIERYLAKGSAPEPEGFQTKKAVLKRHLSYIEKFKACPPSGKVGFMRKVALWYLKAFPGSKSIREKVSLVNTYEDMIKLIDTF